jgi:DNA polymerase III delta prime subunit
MLVKILTPLSGPARRKLDYYGQFCKEALRKGKLKSLHKPWVFFKTAEDTYRVPFHEHPDPVVKLMMKVAGESFEFQILPGGAGYARNVDLYEKYRPKTLEELVGREEVVKYLQERLKDPDYDRDALMLVGASGTGKTTTARIIAETLAKHPLDVKEIPGARIGTIEYVRENIDEWWFYLPMGGGWKLIIVDEAQGMSPQAKEAFLDLIENARPYRMVIFTATKKDGKIPFSPALQSRMKVFQFKPLPRKAVFAMLRRVSEGEGWTKPSPKLLEKIHKATKGNMRAAIQTLEMYHRTGTVAGEPAGEASMEDIRKELVKFSSLFDQVKAGLPEGTREEMLFDVTDAYKTFKDLSKKKKKPTAEQLWELHKSVQAMNSDLAGFPTT